MFGDNNIANFVVINLDDFSYQFDKESCVNSYTEYLKITYNNIDKPKEFKTHDGRDIEITGGDWGCSFIRADKHDRLRDVIVMGRGRMDMCRRWTA